MCLFCSLPDSSSSWIFCFYSIVHSLCSCGCFETRKGKTFFRLGKCYYRTTKNWQRDSEKIFHLPLVLIKSKAQNRNNQTCTKPEFSHSILLTDLHIQRSYFHQKIKMTPKYFWSLFSSMCCIIV